MECILKCGKTSTSGDSIDKITLDRWSKFRAMLKNGDFEWRFRDVWDTTNLCSSKKREQVIIRDAKARGAVKEMPTSTSQSPFTLIHFQPLHYKKEHGYQEHSFTKNINVYGARKRRTRNTQNVRLVNC